MYKFKHPSSKDVKPLKKTDDYRSEFHSHREYLCVVLSFQLSLIHILQFGTFAVTYGGMSFIVSYIVIYIIIGLPLLMSQLLLGQYGRVGQFQVWRIAPIGYGIGYTMMFLSNLKALVDCPVIGFAMTYVLRSFSESVPWKNCKFKGAIEDKCIDEETHEKADTSVQCCTNFKKIDCVHFTYEYAALHYWKQVTYNAYNEDKSIHGLGKLHVLPYGFMAGIWLLILIVVYRGFNRFIKVITYLLAFVGITMTLFLILSFGQAGALGGFRTLFKIDAEELITPELWWEVFAHVIDSQQLSNGAMILFGSFVAGKYRPDRDTIFIGGIKFMITILFTVFFINVYGHVGRKYDFKDLNCIFIKGYAIVFGLAPDLVAELPISQVFNLIYFTSVAVMALIYVILQMIAVVESIVNVFPLARANRFYVVAGMCLTNFLLEMPLLTMVGKQAHTLLKDFLERECSIVVTLIFSIVVFYIYGVQRLADDMEFMLDIQLSQYWKVLWYSMPIVLLVPSSLTIIKMLQGEGLNSAMKITNIILMIFILSPILIVGIVMYYKYLKQHNLIGLCKTDRTWGPQDSKVRKARKSFNPRKVIKYKITDIQCKHNCLIHNRQLQHEEDQIETMKKTFISKLTEKTEVI